MKKVLVAFGTRPEAIKLAPVVKALQKTAQPTVLHSGQHRELVTPILSLFNIRPDIYLDVMQPGQDLFSLTQVLLPKLKSALTDANPDFVIVQGDTSTAYLTALAAFYLQIPVLHVEAGLRSHNPYNPFPEEMNRKQITHLAHHHFAPTLRNKGNLLKEGIPEDKITISGNTVVDALQAITKSQTFEESAPDILSKITEKDQLVVLTAHRRENHGTPLERIFTAVKLILDQNERVKVVFPAHPNPNVLRAIESAEITGNRFIQTEPIDYLSFLHILHRADLILSDSGGIQEEASAIGKPVLVLRNETERQELIELGLGELVGSDTQKIVSKAAHILKNNVQINPSSIFGDGTAAQKIADVIANQL